ncbi:MAG: T9SS type A sorting domain-containing protein [Bacteroidia bacterium]
MKNLLLIICCAFALNTNATTWKIYAWYSNTNPPCPGDDVQLYVADATNSSNTYANASNLNTINWYDGSCSGFLLYAGQPHINAYQFTLQYVNNGMVYYAHLSTGECLSYTLTVNTIPTISVNQSSICIGNTATLTASGTATSYNWSTGDNTNSIVATPTTNTSYTVTGTNNCGTATSTVTVNALPTITASATPSATICIGSNITLSGSGASTYTWSSGVTNSVAFTPTASATYTVTGTDANTCTNTASVGITLNNIPTQPASIGGNNYICTGTANTYSVASVAGATTYLWSLPNVWSGSSTTNSINATAGTSGTLSVTANNTCGNSPAQTISLTVLGLPTVTASAAPDSVCNGSSTTITGAGANTYQWDDGNSNTSQTVSPTANTTYTVTGTDVNNCVSTGTVTVIVNQLPTLTYNQNPTSVCSNHAPFTLSTGFPTGGTYSGLGVTGNTFNPSTAGTGTITITYSYTDAHNCTNTVSKNIVVTNCTTDIQTHNQTGVNIFSYGNAIITNGTIPQGAQLKVYNALGQVVLTTAWQNNIETNLPSGIYTIQVINNDGSIIDIKKCAITNH